MDIQSMRKEYCQEFSQDMRDRNPFELFQEWFQDAIKCDQIEEANAMILATATKDGYPSNRPVLLKELKDESFIFYTNYNSRKSQELADNPRAALVFYWGPLQRVVRVEGDVIKVSEEESSAYFKVRGRTSQIGSYCSRQSQPVESREALMQEYFDVEKKFDGTEVPRPEWWGGWRVIPRNIEFWGGGQYRMHNRLLFQKKEDKWTSQLLCP